ncbi:MAG TPA: hypothetical protein VIG33_05180, partial [Pseudobdellovibrionaceae bacterium]
MEILIAFGLLAILGLGISSMIQLGFMGQKGIEKDYAINNISEQIRGILGDPKACKNTFGGQLVGASAQPITQILDGSTPPVSVYSSGSSTVYESRNIKISAMNLKTDSTIGNVP